MPHYKFDQIAFNITDKKMPEPGDEKMYIGLEHLDSGSLKITRWGSEVELTGQKLVMRKGDVLFGRRNTYLRRAAIAPHDGIFSAHGMIFRPKTQVIDPEYFPFFISSNYFMDAAIRISVGSLSPTVNWKTLKELEFDLPSLEEQRKNAALLKSINETKEAYQELLIQTDNLVKSQFIEMFGELGKDDKGWGITTLGECCELNPKRPRVIDDELLVSFVPMPAVSEDGKIDCSDIKPYKEVRKGFTYFAENDVLFAKITPCMENGKGAVAKGLEGGIGSGSTEFHVLRPIAGKSNPYWLYILTMFESFRVGARKVMTGTGGQLRVPIGYLNDYSITLPPIDLQDRFEEFVHQSDKSKFELKEAIKSCDALMKAILFTNLEEKEG